MHTYAHTYMYTLGGHVGLPPSADSRDSSYQYVG